MGLAFGWTLLGTLRALVAPEMIAHRATPPISDVARGALALVAYGLYFTFAELVGSVWPDVARALAQTRLVSNGLSWTTIAFVSVVNPFYAGSRPKAHAHSRYSIHRIADTRGVCLPQYALMQTRRDPVFTPPQSAC